MQPLKAKARCGLHGTESIVLISRDRSLIYETMDQVNPAEQSVGSHPLNAPNQRIHWCDA